MNRHKLSGVRVKIRYSDDSHGTPILEQYDASAGAFIDPSKEYELVEVDNLKHGNDISAAWFYYKCRTCGLVFAVEKKVWGPSLHDKLERLFALNRTLESHQCGVVFGNVLGVGDLIGVGYDES